MREQWGESEALDNKETAALQARMLVECGRLIERETVWLLREIGIPLDIADEIGRFGPGIGTLASRIESLLSTADRELLEQRYAQFVAEGAPQAPARRIPSMPLRTPAREDREIAGEGQ